MTRPIFVLGIARSGTNLLARMLDRHPQVCVALDPLMPVFRSLRNAIMLASAAPEIRARFKPESPFQDFYFDPDGPASLDTLLNGDAALAVPPAELPRLREAVQERAALESPDLAKRLASIEGTRYCDLIRSAFRIIASTRPGATWVGCKEVWIFDFVPLLARAFPDARFYAMERDPRAIVASLLAMAARDPTQMAHPPSYMRHWRKSIALSRMFESNAELRKRFHVVPYEQLAVRPAAEAQRLCAGLEIEYQPGMVSLSAEGWSGNSSFADGRDVYASSVERWTSSIPADVRGTVNYLCAPEMALTPYRPDPPVAVESVRSYLARADAAQVSWRSSSGDVSLDMAGELSRYQLLERGGKADADQVRRCFLFRETLDAVLQAGAAKARATGGATAS